MPFSRSRSPESRHAVDERLVGPERAGLAEHRVDERGLAVIDVGDDRRRCAGPGALGGWNVAVSRAWRFG